MSIRVGIVGVSGYGGGEVLRLCATHPSFELVYVAGEGSAGQKLIERFPGVGTLGDLVIQKWDPAALPNLDVLFASLPTGESKAGLAAVPAKTKIVDIGGDHRAGAGRGGGSTFGFAEVNEDVSAYGLLKHSHVPEMTATLSTLMGTQASLVFTPHLIPMTRGILSTCYARGKITTADALEAARKFYAGRPFVRVIDKPPHSKWATGSNLAYVSYAADPVRGVVIALGAIDNLGKGAAGQAVQNANLITGQPETAGLEGTPLWP